MDLMPIDRPGLLTQAEFHRLADVPPEAQWFANLASVQTRRAYQTDIKAFMAFVGIQSSEEFRTVARGHVLSWRADLEKQGLAGSSIRRKLAAMASLYEYLCDSNAVTHNPVKGVKRPKVDSYEGNQKHENLPPFWGVRRCEQGGAVKPLPPLRHHCPLNPSALKF